MERHRPTKRETHPAQRPTQQCLVDVRQPPTPDRKFARTKPSKRRYYPQIRIGFGLVKPPSPERAIHERVYYVIQHQLGTPTL